MDEVIACFAWGSENTSDQECRVSVKERRGIRRVYIDAYENGRKIGNKAIFLPDQLPELIEALQKAQAVIRL